MSKVINMVFAKSRSTGLPRFTYTGQYSFIQDGDGHWRIKFLTSGTLTFSSLGNGADGADLFIVGGGGGSNTYAGGGGGYTVTRHELLGKLLAGFNLRSGFRMPEHRDTRGAESICHAGCKRCFRAYHAEVDPVCLRKRQQLGHIGIADSHTLSQLGDTCITGCTIDMRYLFTAA